MRAANCPVCGRSLSRATGAPEATRDTYSASPTLSSRSLAALTASPLQPGLHAPSVASLSPDAGITGLPRDIDGRVLLLTAIALAADLLAPWSIVYGQQKTMAANSAPALALLALFALAALPLLRPSYRARPLFAVAPLAVGAFCLGAGIFYWAILTRENATYLTQSQLTQPGWSNNGSVPPGGIIILQPAIVPGLGLYLFLIGGAVLAVAGYRLFLQAALASARATVGATAQPASHQPVTVPSPASMPSAASISPPTKIDVSAAPSLPLAVASATDSRPVSSVSPTPAHSATPARPIALPGTAAWNEVPNFPAHVRPSRLGGGGWSRQAGVRR